MIRRPLRIATTEQLARSVREAGFDTFVLPLIATLDFNRSLQKRLADGPIYAEFLRKKDIELVLDFNTEALTLVPANAGDGAVQLTTAAMGIPYTALYIDPITSTMSEVGWADHWHVLESDSWIKCIWDTAHAGELKRLGVPNVMALPMAVANDDFDTSSAPEPDEGPVVAFMGHPASSWFRSTQGVAPAQLLVGLTAAAVKSDMPDLTFQKVFYDLYQFGEPPLSTDDRAARAAKALHYFNQKFVYNAFLAIRQRDRFARFLKIKLGDAFELIGDQWETNYGLKHTPRIWDMKVLHDRMRRVPICLNLLKGNVETSVILRHFEITGYGGFMLTYWTPELAAFFDIGKECDVFRDEAELLDKIAYYLEHPKERREIAEAGQRRTLREHLYSHRIIRLVEILRQNGALPRLVAAAESSGAVVGGLASRETNRPERQRPVGSRHE